MTELPTNSWLALIAGNSRLHWALCQGHTLLEAWDSDSDSDPDSDSDSDLKSAPSLQLPVPRSDRTLANLPIRYASVNPHHTQFLQTHRQTHHQTHPITLNDIPLGNTYPSFGLDRALALWGSGETYGWPTLVIDGGTALTFTAGSAQRALVGGAILPGLRLQTQSLGQKTAQLPTLDLALTLGTPVTMPPSPWAMDTPSAIASGILHTLRAGLLYFVQDWLTSHPQSPIICTGGDGMLLRSLLVESPQSPQTGTSKPIAPSQVHCDPWVGLRGMALLPWESRQI
jgi:type III pantothenate kinase